jgi:hypothetical protein
MPEPTPRRSVVPADPVTGEPLPTPPKPMPRNVSAPTPQGGTPPAPPTSVPVDKAPAPAEKAPMPAVAPNYFDPNQIPVEGAENYQGEPGTYSTHVLDYVSPWTRKGRRCCGSVYMDTPYFWFNNNLTWSWIKHDKAPPLVTAGPVNAASPGRLDDPQTRVLFDGTKLQDEPFFGANFVIGGWFDECQLWGGEVGYFFLGATDSDFLASASGAAGTQGLFIPFFNPLTNQEDAFTVADPTRASGIVRINSRTFLNGADGHALLSCWRGASFRVDSIVGVRWIGLEEAITIEENVREFRSFVSNGNVIGSDVGIYDRFDTRNDFIGGDIGLKSQHKFGCWSIDMLGRIAIGGTHQNIRGTGWTGVTPTGFPTGITGGGRLVTAANSGSISNDEFSVVPEFGLTLGWRPRHWLRFTLGYNVLWWSNVVRPGEQIDNVINPRSVPTALEFNEGPLDPARPGFLSKQSDFWAQSLSLGINFMY